jgi:hypothetical protein
MAMANKSIMALFVSICFVNAVSGWTHFRGQVSGKEESLGDIDPRASALQFWWPTTMQSHKKYTASESVKTNGWSYMESFESGEFRGTEKSGELSAEKQIVLRPGNRRHLSKRCFKYDLCSYMQSILPPI